MFHVEHCSDSGFKPSLETRKPLFHVEHSGFLGSKTGSECLLGSFSLFHVEQSSCSENCGGMGSCRPTDVFHVEYLACCGLCGGVISHLPADESYFDLKLKSGAGDSPFCSVHLVKSHDDALSLGGVPVLSLISSKPSLSSDSESRFAAGRLSPPDSSTSCPMKMRPRRDVPLVITTALAVYSPWSSVRTPFTFPVIWSLLIPCSDIGSHRPTGCDIRYCGAMGSSRLTGNSVSMIISVTTSSRTSRFSCPHITLCMRSE